MNEITNYFENYTLFDLFSAITIIIITVRSLERFFKWCVSYLKAYYDKRRGIEKKENILECHTKEIKNIVERMDRMVSSVDSKYTILLKKFDDQEKRLEQIDEDGKKRDCAILRDRIIQSMRFFSKNKDTNDIVHIGMTDYENLEELFSEYFKCGGNGVCHSLYENEFKKFKIDTSKKY